MSDDSPARLGENRVEENLKRENRRERTKAEDISEILVCDWRIDASENERVYDRKVRVITREGAYNTFIDYGSGDLQAPKIKMREGLSIECRHFDECGRFNKISQSNSESGLAVVRLHQAASQVLTAQGAKVTVCS